MWLNLSTNKLIYKLKINNWTPNEELEEKRLGYSILRSGATETPTFGR